MTLPTAKPRASNTTAMTSALVGGVVAVLATGGFGYSHAKSAWEAAGRSAATLNDYIGVADAFWDALPFGLVGALIAGLVFVKTAKNLGALRAAIGLALLTGVIVGQAVDPAKHLRAYQAALNSERDTGSIWATLWDVYGPVASICALIAGAGLTYAAIIELQDP